MKRREFITLLGGAAAASAWPLRARSQQPNRMRRIGVLLNSVEADPLFRSYMAAFVEALGKLGWVEGRSLHIDHRWVGGDVERARVYAAELVGLSPDAILASSTTNLKAVQKETQSIPIVFVQVSDPVAQGFVPSLTHPGGNITGFAAFEFSMGGKWLELLKEIASGIARIAIIFNPDTSPQSQFFVRSIAAAAPSFGVEAMASPVHEEDEIEPAINRFSRQPGGGLIFPTDSWTELRGALFVGLAARYQLPALYTRSQIVKAGGLMSYIFDGQEQFRQAATYLDRILKGANPGDLPIQLPTKFELTINLKTAKGLGLTAPPSLLATAEDVIE